jgi:hypothetical protein
MFNRETHNVCFLASIFLKYTETWREKFSFMLLSQALNVQFIYYSKLIRINSLVSDTQQFFLGVTDVLLRHGYSVVNIVVDLVFKF